MAENSLTKALDCAATSLADNDYMEALTCFCFEPGRVYTFDDHTATIVQLEHKLHGGLRGEVLQRLCQTARAGFTLEQQGDVVLLQDGDSKIQLPLMEPDYFLLDLAEDKTLIAFEVGPKFFEALDWASTNVLPDAYQPALAGITLNIQPTRVRMYAFDFHGLLRSSTKIHRVAAGKVGSADHTIILPVNAANRARRIYSTLAKTEPVEIRVGETSIRFVFEQGKVELHSKLVTDEPVDFEKQLADYPEEVERLPIPADLAGALERCLVLTNEDESYRTKFITSEKGLRVIVKGVHGNADIRVPTEVPLPKARFYFSPKVLSRKLKICTHMSFTLNNEKAIHFFHPRMKFVVGVLRDEEVEAKVVSSKG